MTIEKLLEIASSALGEDVKSWDVAINEACATPKWKWRNPLRTLGPYGKTRSKSHEPWWVITWYEGRSTVLVEAGYGEHIRLQTETPAENLGSVVQAMHEARTTILAGYKP